jgi:hypothetical protein
MISTTELTNMHGAGVGALGQGKCGRVDRSITERPSSSSHRADPEVHSHRASVCSKKPCCQAGDVVGKRDA